MPSITTHILDTSLGKPASEVIITLEDINNSKKPTLLCKALSNDDGRVLPFLYKSPLLSPGPYRLSFMVEEYFLRSNRPCFYPIVCVHFFLRPPDEHLHIPLLLSSFGYSTYRGS